MATPRPEIRAGFFVSLLLPALVLATAAAPLHAGSGAGRVPGADSGLPVAGAGGDAIHPDIRPPTGIVAGRVLDSASGAPVPGAAVRAVAVGTGHHRGTVTDSTGRFRLQRLPVGRWQIEVRALAYRAARRRIDVAPAGVTRADFALTPLPLVMDEVVVRARRDEGRPAAGFVEHLEVPAARGAGGDLARVVESAVGVDVRRYGGLGTFSTLSIRGSTSEQVLVYLDGVPLNQAAGGGVDLGSLPVGGVESVDVYRGAVPGRFGGNSLGGVVHIRTRHAGGGPRLRLRAQTGSFSSRELSAAAGGRWRRWDGLAVADYASSANDFRFWDDNGTEYNRADDGWATRRNSDFRSGRLLLKAVRALGAARLQVSSTQDLSQRGLPGIGNYQALHTRYDVWRSLTEANLFGPWGADGRHGVRLKAYHTLERGDYRDLLGEVGVGTQHDVNTTTAVGARGEWSRLLGAGGLLTAFGGIRREHFDRRSLLASTPRAPANRRWSVSAGAEVESPFLRRGRLTAGWQVERLSDDFADPELSTAPALSGRPSHTENLWGVQLGAAFDLRPAWTLRAHLGRYGRAPSFFELFGDRGAVFGNTDLVSEHGSSLDAGLVYGAAGKRSGVTLAEVVVYANRVDDLIRFIQNSQRVSRPHNIGRARLRGLESRLRARVHRLLALEGAYTWQDAENRSPFPFEHGNDLPNAPAHKLRARAALAAGRLRLHYEVSRESRHYLDRANLRPVPARTLHGVGARVDLTRGLALTAEARNLTDNRVADLWGYPLPGRALFLSLAYDTAVQPLP